MGVTPPGQSKNESDLKFGKHTPIDLVYKMIFCFFEKITLTTASLEELPCQDDFLQITSIALYILFFFFWHRAGELLKMKQLGRKNNINNENYAIFS